MKMAELFALKVQPCTLNKFWKVSFYGSKEYATETILSLSMAQNEMSKPSPFLQHSEFLL